MALAKEANAPRVIDAVKSEARSRGVLEQQPIIVEADLPAKENTRPTEGKQKSKTISKKGDKPSKESLRSFYGTSNDDRDGKRGRVSAPSFGDSFPLTPEFTRQSSPYVFTPKDPESSKSGSQDSGYFSSPDAVKANHPDKRNATVGLTTSAPSEPLKGKGKSREGAPGSHRTRPGAVFEFAADDDDEATKNTRTPKSARYSSAPSEKSQKEVKPPLRDLSGAEPRPRVAELKAEAFGQTLRKSDPALDSSDLKDDETTRSKGTNPPPLASHSKKYSSSDVGAYARSDRVGGSRPSSPVLQQRVSPQDSPRMSYVQPKTETPSSGRTSGHSSVPGSRTGSRPPSPKSAEGSYLGESVRRSSTLPSFPIFPVIPEDKSQPKSKLSSSSIPPETNPRPLRLNTSNLAPARTTSASSLPYPMDDILTMPSEEVHRYKPNELESPIALASPGHKKTASRDSDRSSLDLPSSPMRPRMASRHTFNGNLPTISTSASVSIPSSKDLAPAGAQSASPQTPRAPPPCPRFQSSRQYDDWYTLEGCPSFDICPSCYDANFASGSFWKYFQRAARKEPKQKTRCDFSSPWIRLAWLLTQEQRRNDLDLLYGTAFISAQEPHCPGDHSEARRWLSPIDSRGSPVENFDVCSTDVKRIEALMPSLRNSFSRKDHATNQKRKCDLRVDSKRFSEYVDMLIEIDNTANTKRRPADFQRFVDLARQKAQMRECARDDMLVDYAWHFIPQLPELTVCEECYSSVIWPAIAKGSSVASRFNRTPQLVYEEKRGGGSGSFGTSCQLYSPRMRKVFKKACQFGDLSYLAERAKERKKVEMSLQSRFATLRDLSQSFDKKAGKDGYKASQLQQEFERISDEWRQVE